MVKQKPTKKVIETVISKLITHVQILEEKLNALDSLFGLYLEWSKDKEKFNKFVQQRLKEHQDKNPDGGPGEKK